jgi:hypothetical protein
MMQKRISYGTFFSDARIKEICGALLVLPCYFRFRQYFKQIGFIFLFRSFLFNQEGTPFSNIIVFERRASSGVG